MSREMIPAGDGSRLVVRDKVLVAGQDDILTQVWYQSKEQSALWIDPPTSEEQLVEMMARVGFDTTRVRNWIDRRQKRLHILIVAGIKRPRQVLGKSRDEEWVAFELKRVKEKERSRWRIATRPVLESFSHAMARSTSGFQTTEQRMLMIGAGSLGSELAESLCRSGVIRLTVIDYDTLRPHNLARHTLASEDIGRCKAEAVARKMNGLYGETTCTPVCEKHSRHVRQESHRHHH